MASDSCAAEIIIKKPIEQVFGFVSDLRNLPSWSGASEVKVISETSDMVGSSYEVVFSNFLTKSTVPVEITKFVSPDSFSFRDNSKQVSFNYIFEKLEEGTKVSLNCEPNDSPFSFSRLKMEKLLESLKKHLESQSQV